MTRSRSCSDSGKCPCSTLLLRMASLNMKKFNLELFKTRPKRLLKEIKTWWPASLTMTMSTRGSKTILGEGRLGLKNRKERTNGGSRRKEN